jgi:hypothetical protein
MKIVVASPLYPPDIAEPAPYIKELATRLSTEHEITVVTYGRLPEAAGRARIIAVDKRRPLPLRLARYTLSLWKHARKADTVYMQNGASVELPMLIIFFLTRKTFVLGLSDMRAHTQAKTHALHRTLEHAVTRRAGATVEDFPPVKPEILPCSPTPEAELTAWNTAWEKHCTHLLNLFSSKKSHE